MATDGECDELYEDESDNQVKMSRGAAAWEAMTRVELDASYTSEKALNLEMLLIQVEDVASDYAALSVNMENLTDEAIGKAFEFDILSGVLYSAVKELDHIVESGQKHLESVHCEDHSVEIEEQLQDAEKSLERTRDVIADIKVRSAKFESDLVLAGLGTRSGADGETDISSHPPKNTQNEQKEQQRLFLQMLEKSLATELDLEKKLSEARHRENELKLKLHYAEQTTYNLEDLMEMILHRTLEAENASEILLGISKELLGKLQILQFNLQGSVRREGDERSKLEENMKKLSSESSAVCTEANDLLQENDYKASLLNTEDEDHPTTSEIMCLRVKLKALEGQLIDSDSGPQIAKTSAEASHAQEQKQSKPDDMENIIQHLKEDLMRLESRAETAEEKCSQLTKIKFELSEQLDFLRSNGTEKTSSLERKLKESDTQLEHARASIEAIEEQQSMLYSAISDMENLIEDLKGKVSKAESRADYAESKCTLLTETNLELNEELGFLRSRLECLEASLNQAEDARLATAKDIGIRTKFITDLVMKLAMERERLQSQISTLSKQNKYLTMKNSKTKDSLPNNASQKDADDKSTSNNFHASEETLRGSVTANLQVDESTSAAVPRSDTSFETAALTDDSGSKMETVRAIEAAQLNFKYLFMAVLVLLVSIFIIYLFQLEN